MRSASPNPSTSTMSNSTANLNNQHPPSSSIANTQISENGGSSASLHNNDLSTSNQSLTNGNAINASQTNVTATSSNSANKADDLRYQIGTKNLNNSKVEKVDLEAFMKTDWRHFNCTTWHLEPTVR